MMIQLLLSFIITFALECGPVAFYRFVIRKKPVESKTISCIIAAAVPLFMHELLVLIHFSESITVPVVPILLNIYFLQKADSVNCNYSIPGKKKKSVTTFSSTRGGKCGVDFGEYSRLIKEIGMDAINDMKANELKKKKFACDSDFGLVVEKPIFTKYLSGSEEYLESLETVDGKSISWERIGCTSSPGISGMTDIYKIFCDDAVYRTLYINMYASSNSTTAPEGFRFKNADEANIPNSLQENPSIEKEETNSASQGDSSNELNRKMSDGIKFCFKCGNEVERDAIYCKKCGNKIR